jgi:hypothetical protein
MAKSIRGIAKKRRGRPKTTGEGTPVMVRLHDDILSPLDRWIADQPDPQPTRPEAVRKALHDWLTGLGLMPSDKSTPMHSSQRGRNHSAEMAERTLDGLADQSALADDQAKRKRRLLKGPKEFRDVRKDHPKSRRSK